MKTTNRLTIFLACLLTTSIASAMAPEVQQNPPTTETPTVQIPQITDAGPSAAELEQLMNQEGARLTQIEELMKNRHYGEALEAAKESLDNIKTKTGVDPKVTVVDPIPVKGVLTSAETVESVADLPFNTQVLIKEAVRNYKGGWYLDLINLAKRTYVHWAAAQYLRYSTAGKLFDSDRQQILHDLASAYNYPIYIQDQNLKGGPMLISDKEVASSDQQYAFNREILALATTLPQLQLNEQAFEQQADQIWAQKLQEHRKSLGDVSEGSSSTTSSDTDFGHMYVVANLGKGDQCYNANAAGVGYGDPVYDRSCHASFKVGNLGNGPQCYNADVNGKVYGDPVYDSYCNGR